ncbi:TPA: prepilin-type N-terminal cleavage/methylation domain-containing protein [Vibrio vulnificus]|uniref:Prepilin-type cleavage/methylation domain-containing protein n=2 Tax=Vibrionaceae TaxID=641 RepID=A0ABX4WYU1_VIBVL|nr:prepilin-type N-terminal cleavage/methylation domain-containing protein [Vibrio vulnificus]EWS67657.1 fimbrial protein [Vibrio vulnificus BAA87]OZT86397.1 prepilin-type cleavage/methylation domain-containing protein [Vibrio sp. 03_296]POC69429.1 prepilin-type cleavage/methylation domain-containing protein [Vibrio vulnificus Env1]EGQ7929786.1 prepilin-type N-terminal cleavage/methylation domain-containing protein [Vibrio vulnificus]
MFVMIRNFPCKHYKKHSSGMTLIELLIAVVIVGVLASISYPSYNNYVIESHRTVAKADMAKIQLELERSYNGGYQWTQILSGSTCLICESLSERYTFSVASSASAAYTITATAQTTKGQNNDPCLANETIKKMTLNSTNQAKPAACW